LYSVDILLFLKFQHVTYSCKIHYVANLSDQAVNVIDFHSMVTWVTAALVLSVDNKLSRYTLLTVFRVEVLIVMIMMMITKLCDR